MLIVDRMLIGGIRFVLDKVISAVDQELNDDTALREQLLAAQMLFELGEIDQAELDAREADVLGRMREIRQRREGEGGAISLSTAEGTGLKIVGAEATLLGDETGHSG